MGQAFSADERWNCFAALSVGFISEVCLNAGASSGLETEIHNAWRSNNRQSAQIRRPMKNKVMQLFALTALAFTPACWAQSPLAGDWQGTLSAGGMQYRIVWHITAANDGSLSATIDNLDMGIMAIPVKSMTLKDSAVTQIMDGQIQINGESHPVRGMFAGTLNKDATEIKGTWTQAEPEQPPADVVMKRAPAQAAVMPATVPAAPQQIAGDWLGILSTQGSDIHVVLHIIAAKDGTLSANADTPDQGMTAIPGSGVSFKDSKLHIAFDSYNGVYEGTLSADATSIKGTWTTDQPTELNFMRAAPAAPAPPTPAPAAPKPPDPKN
jgi:hypothetical protein